MMEAVSTLQKSSGKYRELATGILLQYADSEMAGSAGYANSLALAPSLSERIEICRIASEKLSLAQKTYDLVAQTGINIDKYIASHCWEARLQRNVALGYRRMSGDRRVNALMYPIEGWTDLAVFTYLMASMACLQLADFSKSTLTPWAQLAASHLPVEQSHRDFGIACLERLCTSDGDQLRSSLKYWQPKVLACFGPPQSEGNAQYLEFALKTQRNEELAAQWHDAIDGRLSQLLWR